MAQFCFSVHIKYGHLFDMRIIMLKERITSFKLEFAIVSGVHRRLQLVR